jgi:hypothetical protein
MSAALTGGAALVLIAPGKRSGDASGLSEMFEFLVRRHLADEMFAATSVRAPHNSLDSRAPAHARAEHIPPPFRFEAASENLRLHLRFALDFSRQRAKDHTSPTAALAQALVTESLVLPPIISRVGDADADPIPSQWPKIRRRDYPRHGSCL